MGEYPKLEDIELLREEINLVLEIEEKIQKNDDDFDEKLLEKNSNFEEDLKARMVKNIYIFFFFYLKKKKK